MTEETVLKHQIKDFLRLNGWFVVHFYQGPRAYHGIPDLEAIKNRVVIKIETKSLKGKQSQKQIDYQKDYEAAGGNYILARSLEDVIDWINDNYNMEMEKQLKLKFGKSSDIYEKIN